MAAIEYRMESEHHHQSLLQSYNKKHNKAKLNKAKQTCKQTNKQTKYAIVSKISFLILFF
jgi:hypothetical protein